MDISLLKSRVAFTMIELIFVIVILAILAFVALSKFMLRRADAHAAVVVSRLANCVTLAGKSFSRTQSFNLNESNCIKITVNDPCFYINL